MALLNILQSLSLKVLSSKPPAGFSSGDPKVAQAIEYINEAGQELAARANWQVLTSECSFNTVASESQGTIQALTGPGFAFIVNNTFWNRAQRRPVFGPKTDAEWQQLKAQFMQGPWIQYRIRANQMLFLPIPAPGQQCVFEWCTNLWAANVSGAPQNAFLADSDISLLDERVVALDALWRYKRANKFAYDEDYDKAQAAIEDLITRDGSKPTLNLGGMQSDILPGIIVPAGNWGL